VSHGRVPGWHRRFEASPPPLTISVPGLPAASSLGLRRGIRQRWGISFLNTQARPASAARRIPRKRAKKAYWSAENSDNDETNRSARSLGRGLAVETPPAAPPAESGNRNLPSEPERQARASTLCPRSALGLGLVSARALANRPHTRPSHRPGRAACTGFSQRRKERPRGTSYCRDRSSACGGRRRTRPGSGAGWRATCTGSLPILAPRPL